MVPFFYPFFSFPTQFPRLRSAFGLASLEKKKQLLKDLHHTNISYVTYVKLLPVLDLESLWIRQSWTTVKSPPPQGQGRFIKIADPSVCPTKGDFFFEGHLVIRTRPSGDLPDPSVCPTGGDSTSVLGEGGLYCKKKQNVYVIGSIFFQNIFQTFCPQKQVVGGGLYCLFWANSNQLKWPQLS